MTKRQNQVRIYYPQMGIDFHSPFRFSRCLYINDAVYISSIDDFNYGKYNYKIDKDKHNVLMRINKVCKQFDKVNKINLDNDYINIDTFADNEYRGEIYNFILPKSIKIEGIFKGVKLVLKYHLCDFEINDELSKEICRKSDVIFCVEDETKNKIAEIISDVGNKPQYIFDMIVLKNTIYDENKNKHILQNNKSLFENIKQKHFKFYEFRYYESNKKYFYGGDNGKHIKIKNLGKSVQKSNYDISIYDFMNKYTIPTFNMLKDKNDLYRKITYEIILWSLSDDSV